MTLKTWLNNPNVERSFEFRDIDFSVTKSKFCDKFKWQLTPVKQIDFWGLVKIQ